MRWKHRAGHIMVGATRNPWQKPSEDKVPRASCLFQPKHSFPEMPFQWKMKRREHWRLWWGGDALWLLGEWGELSVQVPDPSSQFPQVPACQHPLFQGYLSSCLLLRALGSKWTELVHTCHINQWYCNKWVSFTIKSCVFQVGCDSVLFSVSEGESWVAGQGQASLLPCFAESVGTPEWLQRHPSSRSFTKWAAMAEQLSGLPRNILLMHLLPLPVIDGLASITSP